MEEYQPYIVTVICSMISGFGSYFAARRQAKTEIQKLQKQHELDLEAEREKFKMEKEKMELVHKQELERLTVQAGGQVGGNMLNSVMQAFMTSQAGKEYLEKTIREKTGQKNIL